ncbi:MAG: hypothetical protein JMN24_16715 [gamma proteobacterium endosymbiont of Lamellibrachia anaximandri]|nr:hypothetical protein [gamma proteobacterium endosymbiont of Lamellibrachia anaximandri]MBL3618913.1 hypothetical protein [gamma proteobacterium endosymbiont of Lamellibrachia anaximandri]
MIGPFKWIALLLSVVSLLIAGCSGNTFGVKEVAFTPPPLPTSEQTQIFVFREDSAFGGARKFSIINNDTIVGVVTPGTFTHYTVESGENEVVAYMSPSPLTHFRVLHNPGKTIYLFCHMGYTTGIFIKEIDEEKAKALMQTFKYTEIAVKGARAKMDYKQYYDNLYR